MNCRIDYIMVLLHEWNNIFFMLTTVVTTGSTYSGTEKDIMHATADNPFIIRTWSVIGSTLFITVKKDNNTIIDASMGVGIANIPSVQNSRMVLKYNQTKQEVSLLFENISKEDGGLYKMKESLYSSNPISNETEAHAYENKDGTWDFEIYVLGPGDIKQFYVGDNISMEFAKSTKQSTLYNYDEIAAVLAGSSCSVSTDSYFYGRLRCANDESGNMYKITIVNASQREAGLYKITTSRIETGRYFFSIKGTCTTCQSIQTTQHDVTTESYVTKQALVTVQHMDRHYIITTTTGGIFATTSANSRNSSIGESNSLQPVSVPIYLIPVIIVVVGVFNLMVCCVRQIWSKSTSDRHNAFQECDADAYITSISVKRPQRVPLMTNRRPTQTNASPNDEFDSSLLLLHRAPTLCMDGYEMVDIPSENDHQSKLNNDETIYESTETNNTDFQDTSGYLTVIGVLETSV